MDKIDEFLENRKQGNNLRVLSSISQRIGKKITLNGKDYIDFSSNNYLSIAQHPKLIEASINGVNSFGAGSCASRLLSGDSDLVHQLEDKIAGFKGKESALVFNSGYQANVGIISSLYSKEDVVFADRLSHASTIDGIGLSRAKMFRFNHNDHDHLETLLKKERSKYKNSLIVTESIFSMDGDFSPLKQLVDLKNKYRCNLMVDEAHATGIFGKNGSGLVEENNLSEEIELIMGTFGKALGSFGAYLSCSNKIKQYLINTCRSFIYSTALPPGVVAANVKSLELISEEPFRRVELLKKAKYFCGLLNKNGFAVTSLSQIIPIIVGENEKAVGLSEKLRKEGYYVLPIRHPTVPKGSTRIRFSLTYEHTREDLEGVVSCLKESYK